MNNTLYYLNRNGLPNCPQIPTRYTNYLDKNNYLSEFITPTDKEIARLNLGIPDIVDELNYKIDAKVIDKGDIAWDLVPTEGNTEKVLSSHALYNTLLNYTSKTELDNSILLVWTDMVHKINETYNKIEDELNQLNVDLRAYTDELRCEFDSFTTYIKQELCVPFETRIRALELQMETFLLTVAGGTALTNLFGDSEYIGVNQKVLTDSINKIWEKLSEISGEEYKGITLVVTPEYFIGEDGCEVNIKASTEKTNGIFEHIELYINGEKFYEEENVEYLELNIHVDETSVLMVKAKILGIEYTQMKTITHYNSFWLGAGTSYEDVMNVEHVIPITNGMKGNYNIYFRQNDHLFVIVGDSLREGFSRADMNGMEIPFTESEIIVNGNTYKVFTSNNTYRAGTYNIDVNS